MSNTAALVQFRIACTNILNSYGNIYFSFNLVVSWENLQSDMRFLTPLQSNMRRLGTACAICQMNPCRGQNDKRACANQKAFPQSDMRMSSSHISQVKVHGNNLHEFNYIQKGNYFCDCPYASPGGETIFQ